MYTPTILAELNDYYLRYNNQLIDIQANVIAAAASLQEPARDHAIYGVCRRIGALHRCLQFFFEEIPPGLSNEVEPDVQRQADVFLHAYLINLSGIFDSMAWTIASIGGKPEDELEKEKYKIGLFNMKFESNLSDGLRSLTKQHDTWHEFVTSLRDPTAHRIPPYVIPYIVVESTGKNDYDFLYVHDFKKSGPIPLHAQSIADIGAVVEILAEWLISLEVHPA